MYMYVHVFVFTLCRYKYLISTKYMYFTPFSCTYIPPQGILDVYKYAVSHVQLYGPTNFSSFLDKAVQYASTGVTQESQNYYILLVITVSSVCVCVCVCVSVCSKETLLPIIPLMSPLTAGWSHLGHEQDCGQDSGCLPATTVNCDSGRRLS